LFVSSITFFITLYFARKRFTCKIHLLATLVIK
jgi:hypothetical protein